MDLAGQIASLHLKTEEIKREAELLEDPVLRQVRRFGGQVVRILGGLNVGS